MKRTLIIMSAALFAASSVFASFAEAGERVTRSRDRDRAVIHHHHERESSNAEIIIVGTAFFASLLLWDSINRPVHRQRNYHRRQDTRITRNGVYCRNFNPRHLHYPQECRSNRIRTRISYHDQSPRPWTTAWFDYCTAKFRSFDPESGTFQPHQGPRRLCR